MLPKNGLRQGLWIWKMFSHLDLPLNFGQKKKKNVDFKTCILDLKRTDRNVDNQKKLQETN